VKKCIVFLVDNRQLILLSGQLRPFAEKRSSFVNFKAVAFAAALFF
jgi:hypothetical protein